MGTFYNPPQPMQISDFGFSSPVSSGGTAGAGASGYAATIQNKQRQKEFGAQQQEQAQQQAREKEKASAIQKALQVGEGDINKTSSLLDTIDPVYAKQWEKASWENKAAGLEVETKQITHQAELIRMAGDSLNAGNKPLALKIVKMIDPGIEDIRDTKDKDTKELVFTDQEGKPQVQPFSIKEAVKAATDSKTQFVQEKEDARFYAKLSDENPETTIGKLTAKVFKRKMVAEDFLVKAKGDKEKAIELADKEGVDITFTPAEKDLYFKQQFGGTTAAVAQGISNNPNLMNIYSVNKKGQETPEAFYGKLVSGTYDSMKNNLLKLEFLPDRSMKKGNSESPETPQTAGPSKTYQKTAEGRIIVIKDGVEKSVPEAQIDLAKKSGWNPK